ncbi:MAG: DUF3365 domain-containing protein [Coriobacteriales bacterium]|nr:DUF3365 domain-containing protein [Coriobacteriales bacterium]
MRLSKVFDLRPQVKIVIFLVLLCILFLAFNVWWNNYTQGERAESELLEKARILTSQNAAVWEFMDINQERIDTNTDGTYGFKGVYCAIAGKSIAILFARDTDYIIRFVNFSPRKNNATPDEFETRALEAFQSGQSEYWSKSVWEDREVFRYVTPITITENCLDCHGEPAGELDVTGFPKEGMQLGDLGGAASIIMPIDLYMQETKKIISQQTLFYFALVLLLVITMYLAITKLFIQPLAKLERATREVGSGNLDIDLGDIKSSGEIRKLGDCFTDMAGQLKTLYDDLESKVDARTAQLESVNKLLEEQRSQLEILNDGLKEENDYRSNFFTSMSHELKTPLTSIIAFTDIWEKNADDKDEKEISAVREIKENAQLLLHMVSNILEMARAEAGRNELALEQVDIMDLIGIVEGTIGFLADRKSVKLTTHVHPDVPIFEADWEKLRRIVENLVSNAVKFTRKGGSVHIDVAYDEGVDNIIIEVRDTGIGISEDDLPAIFERFTQRDKSSYRRYSGSGLGLAVLKELVEMHGGSVKVRSVYKQGSVFTVYIPTGGSRHRDD